MSKNGVNESLNTENKPIDRRKLSHEPRGIAKLQTAPVPADVVRMGAQLFQMIQPPAGYDNKDPEQMQRQLDNFINVISATGVKAGNMALYCALGIDKRDVAYIESKNNEISAIVKRGRQFCTLQREFWANSSELDKSVYIFQAKNFDGMSDYAEITINTNNSDEIPADKLIESVKNLPVIDD